MTWFRADDSFGDHPKVKRIPRADRAAAIGLWTLAGTWSARHLQNGKVPDYMIEELAGSDHLAKILVDVELWHITEGGYVFHNWEQWQPTREAVEARRQSEADRKARWRQSKQDKGTRPTPVPPGHVADSARDTTGTDAVVTQLSALPDPTRPDLVKTSSSADADAAFDEFWTLYPRKVGKQKAKTKFAVAVKRCGDAAQVIEGLRNQLPKMERAEVKFIPHPATWLEQGRYEDAETERRERGWWE